jgi:hypothetical protein
MFAESSRPGRANGGLSISVLVAVEIIFSSARHDNESNLITNEDQEPKEANKHEANGSHTSTTPVNSFQLLSSILL